MKTEPPAIDESPATGCEFATNQNKKTTAKADAASINENPALPQKPPPKPAVSFYEAVGYWVMARL